MLSDRPPTPEKHREQTTPENPAATGGFHPQQPTDELTQAVCARPAYAYSTYGAFYPLAPHCQESNKPQADKAMKQATSNQWLQLAGSKPALSIERRP